MMTASARVVDDLEVLVIGEALIDVVEDAGRHTEHVGGSPANVAYGLGRLGVPTALLTSLAHDARGESIERHLAGAGVRLLPESWSAWPTSSATALIDDSGAASYEFDIRWELPSTADVPLPRIVHIGSIGAFLEPGGTTVQGLLERAVSSSLIFFDPNIRAGLLGDRGAVMARFTAIARLASVVKLSDEDAHWLFPDVALERVLDDILALGPEIVAVTRGADGSTLATRSSRVDVPGYRVEVVDTIGAGDSFMASLIASLRGVERSALSTYDIEKLGRRASAASAITVSRAGAAPPDNTELDDFDRA